MTTKIRAAVLGGTGLVGREFLRLLSGHPSFETVLVTASARSAGTPLRAALGSSAAGDDWPETLPGLVLGASTVEAVLGSGARAVFSALPAAVAGPLEEDLRRRGLAVFSNASAHRMDPDVPLVIPEVNADHLEAIEPAARGGRGFIVANSNCTVSGLAVVLKALAPFGLRSVFAASYQAVSGAGRRGVAALDIAGNVIPFVRDEEAKIEREARKMLGVRCGAGFRPAGFLVNACCARVPVRDGHLVQAAVDLARDVDPGEAALALAGFKGAPQALGLPTAPLRPIIVRAEEDRPQPALDAFAGEPARARGMAVSVGRVRRQGGSLNFCLLAHNLVRGAAGTSLLNAELAAARGYLR